MFLAHPDDGAVRQLDILRALEKTPPAIVETIRLDDESLSPSLRGIDLRDLIESPASARLLLGDPHHAESWIRQALREVLALAPDSAARREALAPGATPREMLRALAGVPADARCGFAEQLAAARSFDAETRRFLETKFDNVVHLLTTPERTRLGCALLEKGETAGAARLLRASESLEQLAAVVEALGADELAGRSAELRECAALATVLPALQRVSFAPCVDESAGTALEREIAALDRGFVEALRVCLSGTAYSDSRIAADMRQALVDDIRSFERAIAAAQDDAAKSVVVKRCRAEVELELRCGVDIAVGAGDNLFTLPSSSTDKFMWPTAATAEPLAVEWRLKDIEEIGGILSGLHEGRLLFTAGLNRIELVPSLGENVLGARYQDDGRIKIASAARDHVEMSAQVHNVSSLVFVLTHEIGHGFQIAAGTSGLVLEDGRLDFADGEPTLDFREFASIAGWQVIDPSRVGRGARFDSVVLDGRELPLGEPVEHQGKRIVLFSNPFSGIVISVDADGEFSERWYSRVNPWEDFAEAFAYYHTCPEALIVAAPSKFRHLEEEFRRYAGDAAMQRLLETALAVHRTK